MEGVVFLEEAVSCRNYDRRYYSKRKESVCDVETGEGVYSFCLQWTSVYISCLMFKLNLISSSFSFSVFVVVLSSNTICKISFLGTSSVKQLLSVRLEEFSCWEH